MKTSNSGKAISAVILCFIICRVSALAPAPAPISGMGPPTAAEPSGSSAPMPENDCLMPLANVSDCLSYVTEGSNATAPDPNCCPEMAGLVDSNPICLCQLLSNSSLTESLGIKIEISRALKLPSICRIRTPPVSTCSALGYPVPGPMASSGLSPSQIFPPGAHPPGGLASNPSAGGDGNRAPIISNSVQSFFVGLAFSVLLTIF